jgi:hypothetical protein
MTRFPARVSILMLSLAIVAGLPAAAQVIHKGIDYWRTPLNGTKFRFPDGDVESLCKAKPDPTWNHDVALRGIPAQGSDWDSAVARLDNANFDKNGIATTKLQFWSLALISSASSSTPCGTLLWMARLAKGAQPITTMTLKQQTPNGGVFSADLALRVEMQANNFATGAYVGSLFYDIKLPDPPGGTPWSVAGGQFRPGMTEANNCIQVLRDKLGTFPPGSAHFYFISDLIAKGQCERQ